MGNYCDKINYNEGMNNKTGNCTNNNVQLKCSLEGTGLHTQCNFSPFKSTCNVTLISNDTSQDCICHNPHNGTTLHDTCFCVGLQSIDNKTSSNQSLTLRDIYNTTQCLCVPDQFTQNHTHENITTDACYNSTHITSRTCSLTNESSLDNSTSTTNLSLIYQCDVQNDLSTFNMITQGCDDLKRFNGSIYCTINNGSHLIHRNFNCLNGTEVIGSNSNNRRDLTFLQSMWDVTKRNAIAAVIIISAIILGIAYCLCAKSSNKKIREEQRRKSMRRRSTRRPMPPQPLP